MIDYTNMTVFGIKFCMQSLVTFQMIYTYHALVDMSACPSGPIWNKRAIMKKCLGSEKYHCLYDAFNSNQTNIIYVESCFDPERYKGRRYVISGNLTSHVCRKGRYSPSLIWSDVNTEGECPLLKSTCNEEGQIIVTNGSSSLDRTCRCNFDEGYEYIIRPKDPCNCEPLKEDCSCYISLCDKEKTCLTRFGEYGCETIDLNRDNKSVITISVTTMGSNYDVSQSLELCRKVILCSAFFLGCFCSIFLLINRIKDSTRKPIVKHKHLPVDWFHQDTHQLDEIKAAFEGRHRKKLVLLQGSHGSGKTHTAHQYCNTVGKTYAFVEKIPLSRNVSFNKALKNFAVEILEYKIDKKTEVTADDTIKNILDYFEYPFRCDHRFLLFIDNLDVDITETSNHKEEIGRFISSISKVKNMNIIVATTDQSCIELFPKKDCSVVEFAGMTESEYIGLFRKFDQFKKTDSNEINNLVNVIESIPLVLVSAISYMIGSDKSPETYLRDFDFDPKQIIKALHKVSAFKSQYEIGVIKSQSLALTYVEKKLKCDCKEGWEVVKMLPFLRFTSVSTTVLEAFYYHLTKCDFGDKKSSMNVIFQTLKEVCLCKSESKALQRVKSHIFGNDNTYNYRILIFHRVAMAALECHIQSNCLYNEGSQDNSTTFLSWRKNILEFMLKVYCFEIDIDARTDVIVARNLLFVEHAEKLLGLLRYQNSDDKKHWKFFISYLHCAIGTTYLFERIKIEDAHTHLMKARQIGLSIIDDQSFFKKESCLNHMEFAYNGIHATVDEIKDCSRKLLQTTIENDITKEFVFGKRRSENDCDVIKT